MDSNVFDVLNYGNKFLSSNNIESYNLDSLLLLMHVLDKTKVEIFTYSNMKISSDHFAAYKMLLEKRAAGMPVKYILGHCEFMSLHFIVTPDVLIPRPDTEILVETALHIVGDSNKIVMDIGCGSGCISVSIGHYAQHVTVIAVDISKEALKIARKNACFNSIYNKIAFINSNLFDSICPDIKVDLIISNPPYIPYADLSNLPVEVMFEPLLALDGGEDGLYFYRIIAKSAKNYLNRNGHLLFEIGYNQFDHVKKILETEGYCNIELKYDLSGNARVVSAVSL